MVELDSPKDALSGKRVTKSDGYDWKKSFVCSHSDYLFHVLKCLSFSSNDNDLEDYLLLFLV